MGFKGGGGGLEVAPHTKEREFPGKMARKFGQMKQQIVRKRFNRTSVRTGVRTICSQPPQEAPPLLYTLEQRDQLVGSGDCRVGGGLTPQRVVVEKIVKACFPWVSKGWHLASPEDFRDVPDPWGCSKCLRKKKKEFVLIFRS